MDPRQLEPIRKLRHDLRSHFNGLKLCSIALDCVESKEETLELLEFIDRSCEDVSGTALLIEELPDEPVAAE